MRRFNAGKADEMVIRAELGTIVVSRKEERGYAMQALVAFVPETVTLMALRLGHGCWSSIRYVTKNICHNGPPLLIIF